MRVLIAVPTYENITPDTFKAIYEMDKAGHECFFDFVRGYDCAAARNNIARRALGGGFDFVMMIDNDVIVPYDALANLISHGVDVVSGYYLHRPATNNPDGKTCVCRLGEFNYTDQLTAQELEDLAKAGDTLFHIHGGGMGCVLIKTSVFERLGYPWFEWRNYHDGNVLSEDLCFCEKLRMYRPTIPIYVDPRVACAHLMRRFVWPKELVCLG